MANEVHSSASNASNSVILVVAWLGVGLPLAWGVALTVTKALALFR
ncbi:MAG TPA: hypothetical protein VGM06_04655 [Polyangiaceae bacterium]|jgi:hypothetical protein